MGEDQLPVLVGFVIALIGGLGGLAAILKVSSDNSSSVASGARAVSEGAKTVVDLMEERLNDAEKRLDAIEEYVVHFDGWTDRLVDLLDRVVGLLPEALRTQYEQESASLKRNRPRRKSD